MISGGAALVAIAASACGGSDVEVHRYSSGGDGGDSSVGVGGAGGSTSTSSASGGGGSGTGAGGGLSDACGPIGDIGSMSLGDVQLGIGKAFTICDNTVGFTSLVTAPKEGDLIGVARLKPPVGGSVLLNFAMANHATAVFANYGWVLAANPQSNSTDAFPVKGGKWAITLGDSDGTIPAANASVWYRRTVDGAFHGGVVDVNVFIAPNAATQSYVSTVLDNMFPFGGLELGAVQFFALDASYSIVSSQQELATMLKQSASIPTMPALNLFVIGDFGQQFGDAIGVAGGIPGSPMQHGTGRSGLAYQPSGDPKYDASVLRHETGHVTGLFHTTEYSIDETDPIDDTPSCSPNVMQATPDKCPDTANEMFPIAFGSFTFTPQQEIVIHGSMLYRGIAQDGGLPVPAQPAVLPAGAAPLSPLGPETDAASAEASMARRVHGPSRAPKDSLERVLSSVWCAHGGADYTDLAVRMAGPSDASRASRLRELAEDSSAFPLVRARALKAYVRAAASASAAAPSAFNAALTLASSVARDERAGTDLRVAALRALAAADAGSALSAKAAALVTKDPIVRAAALEVQIEPSARGAKLMDIPASPSR